MLMPVNNVKLEKQKEQIHSIFFILYMYTHESYIHTSFESTEQITLHHSISSRELYIMTWNASTLQLDFPSDQDLECL
jgi:hypothetical protein